MQIEAMTRDEFMKIVLQLPLSADGVPIVPGMDGFVKMSYLPSKPFRRVTVSAIAASYVKTSTKETFPCSHFYAVLPTGGK